MLNLAFASEDVQRTERKQSETEQNKSFYEYESTNFFFFFFLLLKIFYIFVESLTSTNAVVLFGHDLLFSKVLDSKKV